MSGTQTEKAANPGRHSVLAGKTAQAIFSFLVLCAVAFFRDDPYALLKYLRFVPVQGVSLISTSAASAENASATVTAEPAAPAPMGIPEAAQALGVNLSAPDLQGQVHAIEDPTGLAMRAFYEALTRTMQGQADAVTRILHYGDSLVVVDFLTGQTRRRLQTRFGDAGHGYMMAGRPWRWYQHWDVTYRSTDSWDIRGIMKQASGTGYFGLGGYAFDGYGAGQYMEMGTARQGIIGQRASRFEVHYLIQPGGGSFEVWVDGQMHGRVATAGPAMKSGVHEVTVPDGMHTFRVQCVGDGKVRLFGGVLERDKPGLVYDTLGINGARARTLERIEPSFWAEQLQLRRPNLVIFNFGTNESEDEGRPMSLVEADYLSVLQRLRAAVPGASCLVMSPMDRAARVNGVLTTKPILPQLVAAQHRAAMKAGCAFYNTYEAMGGRGSMAQWYQARPRLCAGDMTHPTRAGANLVGDGLYRSLVMGMLGYKAQVLMLAQQQAGAEPLPVAPAPVLYQPLLPLQPDPYPPLPEWPSLPD